MAKPLDIYSGHKSQGVVVPILRNQFYSDRRRDWRQVPWDQKLAERIPDSSADQIASAQLSGTVRALCCLSAEQREVVILVGAGGFRMKTLRRSANAPVSTVKSRVSRARDALMEMLDGQATLHGMLRAAEEDSAREVTVQLDQLTLGASVAAGGKRRPK